MICWTITCADGFIQYAYSREGVLHYIRSARVSAIVKIVNSDGVDCWSEFFKASE